MKITREQGYREIIERLKNQYEWYPNKPDRWVRKKVVDLSIPILEKAIKYKYSIDKALEELNKLDCYRDSNSWDNSPKGLNSIKSMLHSLRMWGE